jgi:sarcosine oxidase/L-pipecolate oxidase
LNRYTDTKDEDFYICESPNLKNVVYATGGSGHAFKFMPILGSIVMDVLDKKATTYTQKFKWRVPLS